MQCENVSFVVALLHIVFDIRQMGMNERKRDGDDMRVQTLRSLALTISRTARNDDTSSGGIDVKEHDK